MKHNKIKYISVFICFFFFTGISFSQKYYIPDANFIRYLRNAYPQVLDPQDSLIISTAETITTNINCPDYGIQSLDGIQFFKNISVLDIYRNNISFLPKLDSLKKLTQILAFNNKLDTFPDISNLKVLNRLFLGDNNLSYLPDLSKNKILTEMQCQNNRLRIITNLDSLASLRVLHFGNNPLLTSLPNFDKLVNLEEIYFYQCNLSAFPDLHNNIKLKNIYGVYNKYNALTDFSIFPYLNVVEITYSYLTFEDLIPLTTYPGFETIFSFIPQNNIGNEITVIKDELASFTIDLLVDTNISTNTYTWFRDGIQIAVTSTSTLSIPIVRIESVGSYVCKITNSTPKLNNVILYSNPIHLSVNNPCLSIQDLAYVKEDILCNGTGSITLDTLSISGGVKPYQYELTNIATATNHNSFSGQFSELNDGKYKLVIKNKINCVKTINNIVITRKNNSNDCKGFAITPDGDGLNDSFYIQEDGTAKIFNSNGKLIKTLSTPASWDGSDQNGQITGDYYLIQINQSKTVTITVIN